MPHMHTLAHSPMPNTIGTAPHRKTTSHKVWDLKMVFPTTASSIRAPCNQSARVNLIAKA